MFYVFQFVTPDNGVGPGEIGIDRRNSNARVASVRDFITASGETRDVTLRASGPRH